MSVNDAYKERFFGIRVGSRRLYFCSAVFDLCEDLIRYLIGVSGYDDELAGLFGTRDKIIPEECGDEAVQYTQAHRLIVIDQRAAEVGLRVNEEGNDSDYGVESEGNVKEIKLGLLFAYVF